MCGSGLSTPAQFPAEDASPGHPATSPTDHPRASAHHHGEEIWRGPDHPGWRSGPISVAVSARLTECDGPASAPYRPGAVASGGDALARDAPAFGSAPAVAALSPPKST